MTTTTPHLADCEDVHARVAERAEEHTADADRVVHLVPDHGYHAHGADVADGLDVVVVELLKKRLFHPGAARHGTARRGAAQHGMAAHGSIWHGMTRTHGPAWHGMAWQHSSAAAQQHKLRHEACRHASAQQ